LVRLVVVVLGAVQLLFPHRDRLTLVGVVQGHHLQTTAVLLCVQVGLAVLELSSSVTLQH
jgi:hypothetical protein